MERKGRRNHSSHVSGEYLSLPSLSLSLSLFCTHMHIQGEFQHSLDAPNYTHAENVQKKYAKAWQMHRATRSPDGGEAAAEATDKGVSEEKKPEPEPEV